MGVSTDAILAFGFNVIDEGSPAEFFGADGDSEDGFSFDDWILELANVLYPEGHEGVDSKIYREYLAESDAALAACPVELIEHCSGEYPMYFLALRGSKTTARRGSPEKVATNPPDPQTIAAMRKFCEEHGIEWEEPAWHIFSMWG